MQSSERGRRDSNPQPPDRQSAGPWGRLAKRLLCAGLIFFAGVWALQALRPALESAVMIEAGSGARFDQCGRCGAREDSLSREGGRGPLLCNACRVRAGDFASEIR